LRKALKGIGVGLAVPLCGGAAQAIARQPGALAFTVLRSGEKPFGHHTIAVTPTVEGLEVRDDTHYEVKVGPMMLYRYTRTCQERWRSGALASFTCATREGGRTIAVSGVAGASGLTVTGPSGTTTYPAGTQHFAPWNLAYASAPLLIDSETGKPLEGGVRDVPCQAPGAARCIRVEGSIRGVFRYDQQGRWIGLDFSAKGQKISYRLRSDPLEAPF